MKISRKRSIAGMRNAFVALSCFAILLLTVSGCTKDVPGNDAQDGMEGSEITTRANGDPSEYYWYKGEKVCLTVNRSYINVIVDEKTKSSIVSPVLQKYNLKQQDTLQAKGVVKFKLDAQAASKSDYAKMVNALKQDQQVKHVLPFYERGANAEPIGTSDVFFIKLKNPEDITLLNNMTAQHGMAEAKEVAHTPLWYMLSIVGSDFSNAVSASNFFYETDLFDDVDPAFMFDFRANSSIPNDPMFGQLWGLKNASYPGFDIDATNAWDVTKGAGATVAVVDQGIDPNHNDLSANFHPLSFDAQSGTSPSVYYQYNYHGTHVAGTVAAVGGNNLQVVGVAPEAKIMRVSHDLYVSPTASAELASGINWAWMNGADVITNSWGDQGGMLFDILHSAILEDAIADAITQGRNGKGSVVVFAAGNFDQAGVDYPANSHDDILTVGAISANGRRAYFSGYGRKLDVVAPGESILSTMPGNQTGLLDGTSMAAPHVAGLVALMLSDNPDLTGAEVRDIIESTCQKLPSYTYDREGWNTEVGFGLVDAFAALGSPVIPETSYWIGIDGTRHGFSARNTPLANFCGSTISDVIINGASVPRSSIKEIAFYEYPDVRDIPTDFMNYFTSLESVDLTGLSNVTSIGNDFMAYCYSLKSVNMSGLNNIANIGANFMYYCERLTSVNTPDFSNVINIGGGFLYKCYELPSFDLSTFTNVRSIGDYFMYHCQALTAIDLSAFSRVTSIGSRFLLDCQSLTSINLLGFNNVTSIGEYFLSYTELTSVDLSSFGNVTNIGNHFLKFHSTWGECRLTQIKIGGVDWVSKTMGRTAMQNVTNLPSCRIYADNPYLAVAFKIKVPAVSNWTIMGGPRSSYWIDNNNVRHDFGANNTPLSNFNYSGAPNTTINGVSVANSTIKQIAFGDDYANTTNLGMLFLSNYNSLTWADLSVFTNVTSIDSGFMYGCSALTSVDLSGFSRVTSMGAICLSYCPALTSVDLSGFTSLRNIGVQFLAYSSLTSIDLGSVSWSGVSFGQEPLYGIRNDSGCWLYANSQNVATTFKSKVNSVSNWSVVINP